MEKKQRTLNNKGFSLIELIVVIAIMAILVGVLAPNVMRYVRRSRVSADTQLADTIRTAVMTALADPDITDAPAGTASFNLTSATAFDSNPGFGAAVATNLGYSSVANMATGIAREVKSMTVTSITAAIDGNARVSVTITDGTNPITVPAPTTPAPTTP